MARNIYPTEVLRKGKFQFLAEKTGELRNFHLEELSEAVSWLEELRIRTVWWVLTIYDDTPAKGDLPRLKTGTSSQA